MKTKPILHKKPKKRVDTKARKVTFLIRVDAATYERITEYAAGVGQSRGEVLARWAQATLTPKE